MWTCALLAFNFRASGLYHNAAKFLSLLSCFVYEIQIKIQKMIVDSYEFSEKKKKKDLLLYMAKKFQITREREEEEEEKSLRSPCHAMQEKRKEKKKKGVTVI